MTTDKELEKIIDTQRVKDLSKTMKELILMKRQPHLKGTGKGNVKLEFE